MSQTHKKLSARVGDREIHIESGKLAKLADGAALVTMGETVIIVTAVSATKVKDGQDFFPLTVEYKEKAAAVGRIPGSYFRREGRPTEKEILTCRMIDRPLRPLFPKGYFYDTQIIAILLSADGQKYPTLCCCSIQAEGSSRSYDGTHYKYRTLFCSTRHTGPTAVR